LHGRVVPGAEIFFLTEGLLTAIKAWPGYFLRGMKGTGGLLSILWRARRYMVVILHEADAEKGCNIYCRCLEEAASSNRDDSSCKESHKDLSV